MVVFFTINFVIMLYLFGSGSWSNQRKVVKIGFTNDIEKRKSQYKLHNPLGEFISVREGNEEDELRLHLRLYDFKVEFLDEWFYDEKEVFDVFSQDYSEIDKWLWDHKSEVLIYPQIPPPGSLKRTLLDNIKSKFRISDDLNGLKLL